MPMLTPAVEHYLATILLQVANAPCRLQVDLAEVMNNLAMAEHQFLRGLHQNKPRYTSESLQEGMKIVLRTAVHKEAKQVVMRDGKRALIATFNDMVVTEATEENETGADMQPPKVVFSKKWLNILYAVVQSYDLKALVKRHGQTRTAVRRAFMCCVLWKLNFIAVGVCQHASRTSAP